MEIKISEELNSIISYARQEAMRTGNYAIRPDHLYLGILRQRSNEAFKALVSLGADPEELKRHIDGMIFTDSTIPYAELEHITFSRSAQNVLSFTILEASRAGSRIAMPGHLLLALSMDPASFGTAFLHEGGVDYRSIAAQLRRIGTEEEAAPDRDDEDEEEDDGQAEGDSSAEGQTRHSGASLLDEFGFDLTKAAAAGQLDPTVGREAEMERVLQILGRRRKNNPMLVGDPGAGKTAIVEGIAMKIASGDVPSDLLGKRIVSLDLASIVAGTRYRGEFEKRLKNIIKEISEDPDVIVFMDEMHTMVGAGSAQGSLDAANILKPALARGEIRCIGATTFEEFSKIVEKDKALDRRFQKVPVLPTDIASTIVILESVRPRYESHHGVRYTREAIEDCVKMSERYITDRCLPDKAIDILDEAGSMVHLRHSETASSNSATISADSGSGKRAAEGQAPVVTPADVAEVVSKITGVPAGNVLASESERLLGMAAALKSRIIGQDNAVDTVARAIRRNSAGLRDPRRPIGTFLFVGPTGVGKTLLAKALAEYLFDSEDNLIRVDMSEYTEKFNISRLIGAPPGYVGYDDGGQLSEKVRRKPYSVVLLDEIEKAHPDVFNLLLQILDEGRMTDSNGRFVDFRNTVLIMTSNAGSRESDEYGKGLGFTTALTDVDAAKKSIVEKSLRRIFPPEFLGRIDERIYFNPLGMEEMVKIIDIELGELAGRMAEYGLRLKVSPAAKRMTVNTGYDPKFGARPLKRAIRERIEDPVSEFILTRGLLSRPSREPLTLKVGISPDRRSTCVYPGPGFSDEASATLNAAEGPAEEEIQEGLSELYVDNFKPHLADEIDKRTQ